MADLTRRAEKDLDELRIWDAGARPTTLGRLDSEPSLGKKLLGKLKGRRSARLGRSHRIIYRVDDDGVVVLTIAPGQGRVRMSTALPDSGPEREIFIAALRNYSDTCEAPLLQPDCPFATLTDPDTRGCGEECIDLFAAYHGDEPQGRVCMAW